MTATTSLLTLCLLSAARGTKTTTDKNLEKNEQEVKGFKLGVFFFFSQKLLRSPRKPTRKISKIPFKVLDAPELQDDFYLNLVDWSSLNVLSVGLGTCVYLWSACTSQVGHHVVKGFVGL